MTTTFTPVEPAIMPRQEAAWAGDDDPIVHAALQIVAETLAEAAGVRDDERVLDVGAIAGTLPFETASFDVVLSNFGVMFSPDHAIAAREMLRVLRPGGRIAMANWTPEGFIGRLQKTASSYVALPAGMQPSTLWGTEPHVVALFGPRAHELRITRKAFHFHYRSAAHCLQVLRERDGPTRRAFSALDAAGAAVLVNDILGLLDEFDIGQGRGFVIPSEYAKIVITVAGGRA